MKKIEKHVADTYFRAKTKNMVICLIIWAIVSYGVVAFAEYLTTFKMNGMPFHYFMGAQGSVLIFIILLWVNAFQSDKLDITFGIVEEENEQLNTGNSVDQ